MRGWRGCGRSAAKLIWGGEAVAVCHEGRANPEQLLINNATKGGLADLRQTLLDAHQEVAGSTDDLVVGLQLTHSGRFSRPNAKDVAEPKIAFRHPLLDRRFGIDSDEAVLSDSDLHRIIDDFANAAVLAHEVGFQFVDIKHCHGYLGHELLGGHTRPGEFGGPFENRTRFLRLIVEAVRAAAPSFQIAVRFSAFDVPPFHPDPAGSADGRLGPGVPEPFEQHMPYRFGFGLDPAEPLMMQLRETIQFLEMLQSLGIRLVNVSAGSPYCCPHIQRPALYPPSDGYQPPEDPLVGVARQMRVVRDLKQQFPDLLMVGSGYSYLQEYLPHVAQAAVSEGWVDSVGLGRMVLSYPELPHDVLSGAGLRTKQICRTFSDCTTAPRKGLVSGCYPLDPYYKRSPEAGQLSNRKRV